MKIANAARQFCLITSLCFATTCVAMEPKAPEAYTKEDLQRMDALDQTFQNNGKEIAELIQQSVFKTPEEKAKIKEKIEALKHANRKILDDLKPLAAVNHEIQLRIILMEATLALASSI